jgi:hypothetical protein
MRECCDPKKGQIPKNVKPAEVNASKEGLEIKCEQTNTLFDICTGIDQGSREEWPQEQVQLGMAALTFL